MAKRAQPRRSAPPSPGLAHGEFVRYPGTRAEVYDLLERLSAAAGDSPDFGTTGLSLDRTRVTVHWFGEPPAAVQAVVDSAPAGLTVTVAPTGFRPGDLRVEAERLAAAHPYVVVAATARPEGDGIELVVPADVAASTGSPEQALAGVTSDVPLFVEVGTVS